MDYMDLLCVTQLMEGAANQTLIHKSFLSSQTLRPLHTDKRSSVRVCHRYSTVHSFVISSSFTAAIQWLQLQNFKARKQHFYLSKSQSVL